MSEIFQNDVSSFFKNIHVQKYHDLLSKHVHWRDLVFGEISSATSTDQKCNQYQVPIL